VGICRNDDSDEAPQAHLVVTAAATASCLVSRRSPKLALH